MIRAILDALAATALAKLGVEVEVISTGERYYKTPKALRESGKDLNDPSVWDWDLHNGHLAVRFRSNGRVYTWDSAGTKYTSRAFGSPDDCQGRAAYPFGHGLTPDEAASNTAVHDTRRRTGWNSMFDRSQIPTIRELVQRHLGVPALAT